MSSKEFIACVVGLSFEPGEPFNWKPGVGKSCLCHRFTHPGLDDYIDSHPSVLALHEFESHVINSDHFLYWGSPEVNFRTTDSHKSVTLKVHIVEQTVFYQDVTCQPFNASTRPDRPEFYNRRISGPIESPGKLSYQSRDDIVSPADYNAAVYPSGISKLTCGFVVVVDVSQKGIAFEQQLNRAEKVLDHLTKHKRKLVIAATKRDKAFVPSLDKVYDMKKKYKTTVVEVSAEHNHNVKECFRVLAYKVLKSSKLSSQVQTYPEAAHISLFSKGSAKRSFISFIKKRINDPDERIGAIERNEEYKDCVLVIGKYETDKLFAKHVLEVFNGKVDLYAGAKDNPEMREEFLEDFVAQREDLALYTTELKEWIDAHIKELDSDDEEENNTYDDLPSPHTPPHIDDYQLFQRTSPHPNPPSPLPPRHALMATPLDTEDNNSYYSASEGSEGPDYVNYDPNDPSVCLDTQDVSPIQNTPLHNTSKVIADPPPISPRQSIKNQANVLASLLGHKSQDLPPLTGSHNSEQAPTTPTLSTSLQLTKTVPPRDINPPPQVTAPPHKVKSPPPPAPPREVNPPPQVTAPPREVKSPPSPAPPRDMKSPPLVSIKPIVKPTTGPNLTVTSIKSRAQNLSTQLGHTQVESSTPPPPAPKPKPPRSPAMQRQLDNAGFDLSKLKSKSVSSESENGVRTPPPVATRVSSLPRNSSLTDSDQDSAPNTPRLTRRPSRVAPPPPIRNSSPPVPVRAAPPPPMQPLSELTPSKPLSPPPPSIDETSEVDPVPKRRLDQIREKISKSKRNGYETNQIKDKPETIVNENISTQLKEPLNEEKIRRESYQKTRIKSASVDPISSVTPPIVRKKYTKHILKSQSEDPGPTPPPPVKQYLARINVDQPTCVSPPPPPLPPRPMEDEAPQLPPLPPRPMDLLDDEAPQLPPRTEEMMVIEEDNKSKPKGPKKNYTNVDITTDRADSNITSPIGAGILKNIRFRLNRKEKSPSTDSEPLTSPAHKTSPSRKPLLGPLPPPPPSSRELPPIPTTPQAQFVVMKNRPLPQEPFPKADNYDDDEGHDYEIFDFNDDMQPVLVKPQLSLDAGVVHSTRGNKEQWSIPAAPPNQRIDVTQSLNINTTSSLIKKSKTFNGNDRQRTTATSKQFNVPKGVWPMYVDGYVNTEHPPSGFEVQQSLSAAIQSRHLPPTPFEQLSGTDQTSKTKETLDYDYPFCRTLPLRGKSGTSWGPLSPAIGSQIPVPPRFPRPHTTQDPGDDEDADDYIHMQTQFGNIEGSYVNSESLEKVLAQIQPENITAENPLSQYSRDDMYMNLPGDSHSMSLPIMQHGASTVKKGPSVLPKRTRAASNVGPTPLVGEQRPSWPSNLEPPAEESVLEEDGQLYVNVNDSLPLSENVFEGDGELYVNVNDSLPQSLFQQIGRGLVSPPRSKQPVNTPTISLPPRNIKRATKDNSS